MLASAVAKSRTVREPRFQTSARIFRVGVFEQEGR
jgi:hypothetical protein